MPDVRLVNLHSKKKEQLLTLKVQLQPEPFLIRFWKNSEGLQLSAGRHLLTFYRFATKNKNETKCVQHRHKQQSTYI